MWSYDANFKCIQPIKRSKNNLESTVTVQVQRDSKQNCFSCQIGSTEICVKVTYIGKTLNLVAMQRSAISLISSLAKVLLKSLRTLAYVTVILFVITSTSRTLCVLASPCDSNNWWDPVRDKCIPCTACESDMIPLRPCQLHRDTICGSIYDVKIDWYVLPKTEPNWKERRKSNGINDDVIDLNLEHHLSHEQLLKLYEDALSLDWQTGALFFAILACLLFFIVAACMLIHHMRQWRLMERRLDQDVEEVSTKLMAKLAEVQSLEGGTFFIGNAEALPVPGTNLLQSQHVLFPKLSKEKCLIVHQQNQLSRHHNQNDRIMKKLQPGNVYTEESSSNG